LALVLEDEDEASEKRLQNVCEGKLSWTVHSKFLEQSAGIRRNCRLCQRFQEPYGQTFNQSINQSMAVTDAGTKVPLYPYHTFYTLLVFKST